MSSDNNKSKTNRMKTFKVTITLMGGRSISHQVVSRSEERAVTKALRLPSVIKFINGESPIAITVDKV
jgi:hypothetical protein